MQESANRRTSSEKQVPLMQSMKVKILFLVIGMLIIMALINLVVSILTVKENITDQNQNYMKAMARLCGESIDTILASSEEDAMSEVGAILESVEIDGMDSSYIYMLSPNGDIPYFEDQSVWNAGENTGALEELLAEMQKGNWLEPDIITYEYDGVKKYASFYMSETLDYILIMSVDQREIFATMNHMIFMTLLGTLATLVVCGIISILILGSLTSPISRITQVVARLSDLDFRENEELAGFVRRGDEIGSMARAAKSMQEKLVQVIKGLKDQSRELYASSDAMNSSADEISRSVEQVEKAVAEIAEGATSQAQETQTATENIILMGDMITEANKKMEELQENAREIRSADEKAMESLDDMIEINQQTSSAIQAIYNQIHHTSISVAEIKKATAIITDIAEETNLLSLNASIEAARAGEAGRGFAVVASQVQQLADQSNTSVGQIDETISTLINEFEETMKTMESVKEVIAKQDEDVTSTEKAFKAVKEGISRTIEGIQEISEKTEKLDEARVRIVDVVQNLTAIAQENAASSEQTSATAVEVNTVMADMSNNAEQLHRIANDLEGGVKQFRFD